MMMNKWKDRLVLIGMSLFSVACVLILIWAVFNLNSEEAMQKPHNVDKITVHVDDQDIRCIVTIVDDQYHGISCDWTK